MEGAKGETIMGMKDETDVQYGYKCYDTTTSDNTGGISMAKIKVTDKEPEIYTINASFEINDVRDVLFEEIWEALLGVYLHNQDNFNIDPYVERLLDMNIAYFLEHHKSEVIWKELKIIK